MGTEVVQGAARVAPRRVLHVSQPTETGVSHVVGHYVSAQRGAGWTVAVASPGGTLAANMDAVGVKTLRWPARTEPAPGTLLRELRALRRIISEFRPDLVHLHSAKAGLVGRLLLRGRIPTVYSPHAWSWLAAQGAQRRLALQWERRAARWAITCCVSRSELQDGRRAGVRGQARVIPNDVDVAALREASPADRAAARAVLGVPPGDLLVVCCARLTRQKGQDVLIEAWRQVRNRIADGRLVLVGDGPDEEAFRSLAGQVGDVLLTGALSREATLAWMTASDVVACPSRYEGMSLVPLEAGALGRVVVATDFEGIREGEWGPARVVVPIDDTHALSSALLEVLRDEEGRRRAEKLALARADEMAAQPGSRDLLLRLYDELVPDG